MTNYRFLTTWELDHSLSTVWNIIAETERHEEWWRVIQKVDLLEAGKPNGLGKVTRAFWTTALPYSFSFTFKVTKVIKHQVIEGEAFGDLEGKGVWRFQRKGNKTIVHHEWAVSTNKSWMNWFGFILRPLFRWNHTKVMQWGLKDLEAELHRLSSPSTPVILGSQLSVAS